MTSLQIRYPYRPVLLVPSTAVWPTGQASVKDDDDLLAWISALELAGGQVNLELFFGNSMTRNDLGELIAAEAMSQVWRGGWLRALKRSCPAPSFPGG